jgi:soluble lytic murein transglycosylase-like protein
MKKILAILLILSLLTQNVAPIESELSRNEIELAIDDRTRGLLDKTYITRVSNAIISSSLRYQLDPLMILSIIMVESRFNDKAAGKYGTGLMQVVYGYHKDKVKSRSALLNIETNIDVGSRILSDCRDRNPNTDKILRCYNGGGDTKYVSKVNREMTTVRRL